MRPAGRPSSVIRFPSSCCAVYILSQHRADFSTGSAFGPLRVCFALNRCEDSLTFFTQYFAPETGAHSERVSERRYVFRGSRSTDRSKNPRSIPSGILHRWLFRLNALLGLVRSGKDSRQGQFSVVVLRAPFECQPRQGNCCFPSAISRTEQLYSRHTLISPEEIRQCQTKSGSRRLKTAGK